MKGSNHRFRAVRHVRALPRLPARRRDAHKGDFGRVLVVGGSRGMIGAPALAANAALRAGAGLVTVAPPETVQLAVAGLCPCATSLPLGCSGSGDPSPAAVRTMLTAAGRCDVLAVGPGLGTSPGSAGLVRAALEQHRPVVLDADGLNNLPAIDRWPQAVRCPLLLTPHPGEFSRLTQQPIEQVQRDRTASAVQACRRWCSDCGARPMVVVLKGAGTVVTDGRRVRVNRTGNPGMATGGTGDVLTGVVAALIGQGLSPFDAACLGVHVHGLAGDLAARRTGQVSLTAWDVLDALPAAFRRLRA